MYPTPVRHDELSIAKSSLRSQIIVSAKELEKRIKEENVSILNNAHMSYANNLPKPTSDYKLQDENGLKSEFDSSAMVEQDCSSSDAFGNITSSNVQRTSFSDMSIGSVITEEKHSTPRPLKFPTNKAVSSTPNQELFSHSKLMRHVSTQTNFTLTARTFNELDNGLKSFCLKKYSEEDAQILNSFTKASCSLAMDITSPLRDITTSKSMNGDETPLHSKQVLGRKLSLRSKTMISSAMGKTKENPRVITRHKSVEEKRLFSNTFSLMPHPKTPPSNTEKVVHNPFEVDLPQRLGKSMFSPDVFDNVISPSEDSEYFRWTIEDISSINPMPIDEDFTFPSDDEDPEKESLVQQEIDRYFSETHNVLSPFDVIKQLNLNQIKASTFHAAIASTPQKARVNSAKQITSAGTQTVMTLPESLTEDLEESLKSYFRTFESDDFNMSATNLRRKLFFRSEDEPPSPVRFETCINPGGKHLWTMEHSPITNNKNERYFSPLANQQELSSPEISPVFAESSSYTSRNNSLILCKKPLHLYFSGNKKIVEAVTRREATHAPPSSQDTGYQTEESWKQSTQTSPSKLQCLSVMASTPTQIQL